MMGHLANAARYQLKALLANMSGAHGVGLSERAMPDCPDTPSEPLLPTSALPPRSIESP
jgi:hypothetical protein